MHNAGKPVSYEQAIAYSLGENAYASSESYQMSPSSNIRGFAELARICILVTSAGARLKAPQLERSGINSVILRA
jgi:hypothetical protein